MNNLLYIKHTHTQIYIYVYINVSKPESRNPVFICSHLALVPTDEGYESALSGTAEDTAINMHLRGIFGLVGITESTFVDNMFFCRQRLSLSLLYIFVQRIC